MSIRNKEKKLPLWLAVEHGHTKTAVKIIERGGAEYLTPEELRDLTKLAISEGYTDIVSLLDPVKEKTPPKKPGFFTRCLAAINLTKTDQRSFSAELTGNPSDFKKYISGKDISIVIGGPPCQGWSPVGRGKLKSLGRKTDSVFLEIYKTLHQGHPSESVSYPEATPNKSNSFCGS